MAVGPTGYEFFIDLVESDHSALTSGTANQLSDTITTAPGANTELTRITEFSGIDETGVTVDLTALGDRYRNKGALGVSEFASITLKGYVETQSTGALVTTSAHARIGRPAKTAAYPKRRFRVKHVTGLQEQLKVIVAKNRRIPSKDDQLMWEATLEPASVVEADFITQGI